MSQTQEGAAMSESPTPQTPTDSSPNRDGHATERSSYLDGLSPKVVKNAGRRTSGTVEHLLLEAELAADGHDLDNPAVPAEDVIEDVLERLDGRGLEPAWIVCRGDGDE